MSSFINFNNRGSVLENKYSAEVIKTALLKSETKSSAKAESLTKNIKEPVSLNEALVFFTDKLGAIRQLNQSIVEVNEGRVKQFEMDYASMVKDIKKGYGWIDPEYVAQTWDNSSDSIDFELVRDELFDRLIAAGLLAHADDNNPEEAGKYIKSVKDLYVMESEVEEISEDRYYAFHKGQKHEIEADSLWGAKQKAITDLKVKKKDVGMLAIVLADSHDDFSKGKNSEFAFEGETTVYESATAQLADEEKFELYTATLKNKTATLKATTTTKTWDDGVPVLKYLARGKGKPTQVNINGSFEVAHDVARGWFYFTDGRKWFGLHIEDGYGDAADLPFNMEVKESVVTEARFVKDFNRDVLNAKTKEEVLELYPNAEFFIGKSDHFFGELDTNLFFKAYYTKAQKEFEIKSIYSEKGSNYVHLYNESVVTEAVKEVTLSNRILNFLEERGVIKASDSQKIHKDLTAFLKKNLNESAVTEAGMNDPVLVAFRAAKMNREKELAKPKRRPLYGKQRMKAEDDLWQISQDLKDLYADRGQMLIDMEQEAEVEGGPIADEYGDRLNKVEDQIQKLIAKRSTLEMRLAESFINEEEDYSDEMTYGQLERCIDYATMLRERYDGGFSFDPWMHSAVTTAKNELNSVFDALDGGDGVIEGLELTESVMSDIHQLASEVKESVVTEKREDVGKYNTVKKVIAELGRRPSEQELATFITNNYYDVTEVERGDDDPASNDKIADLVAFYKFDIDDWNIAWADAQNESVVTESTKLKKGDVVKFKDGKTIYILEPKGDGYDYRDSHREKGHHPKGWFDMMISTGKAVVESVITEGKALDRDAMMDWLDQTLSFTRTSEEFDGAEGGIWTTGENGEEWKGKVIYAYYSEDYKNRTFGVLNSWEKELNKRGWYSEWYDAGTVMIWPN